MKRYFLSDFSAYLEWICSQMVALKPMNEDCRTFFRGVDKDFANSLRSRAQFPCVIREGIGWRDTSVQYSGEGGVPAKHRQLSFVVAMCYEAREDYAAMDEAHDICEEIGEEIVRRMWTGCQRGETQAIEAFDWGDVSTASEVNEQEKVVMVQFRIKVTSVVDVCLAPEMWEKVES